MTEREERIKAFQDGMNRSIDLVILTLDSMDLAEGVDKNSWLFAGCRQDLEKARTRILKYIKRVLK